jgi:hypothetical protein
MHIEDRAERSDTRRREAGRHGWIESTPWCTVSTLFDQHVHTNPWLNSCLHLKGAALNRVTDTYSYMRVTLWVRKVSCLCLAIRRDFLGAYFRPVRLIVEELGIRHIGNRLDDSSYSY